MNLYTFYTQRIHNFFSIESYKASMVKMHDNLTIVIASSNKVNDH